jgi:hypothetical protein
MQTGVTGLQWPFFLPDPLTHLQSRPPLAWHLASALHFPLQAAVSAPAVDVNTGAR